VTVASGTLNVLTNVNTPGGPGQRFVVGGRTPAQYSQPNSAFDEHFSQLVVSNTGALNVGGGGLYVGRNAEGSAGEFLIKGTTSLKTFATTAKTWGWDVSFDPAIPLGGGTLLMVR
jgi:hypothetical protein